jgi:RNA polymerase sigma-70 factor (ECF subfamily)
MADAKEISAFKTTEWTDVLEASGSNSLVAAAALEILCQKYWYPLYAFGRRRGHAPHDAEDLTQAFFAHLLDKDMLKNVDREKGRFRSFLLASFTNFLNNDWDKQRRLKRGGGKTIVSFDEMQAEERYQLEPADDASPEKLFERRWAWTVVEQVLAHLRQEYTAQAKADVFAKLEPFLTTEFTATSLSICAAELQMTENALKVARHRLRRRFGENLRSEIARTVATPEEVQEEIRHLFAAISL